MLLNFIIAIQLEERVSVTVTAVWKSGSDMTFNNQGTSGYCLITSAYCSAMDYRDKWWHEQDLE